MDNAGEARGTTKLDDRPGAAVGDRPRLSGRQIAAVCAGNALEFYDFVVYAIFAAQIVSLLASLATFGVGFATRPLGALVIGRLGDRAQRR